MNPADLATSPPSIGLGSETRVEEYSKDARLKMLIDSRAKELGQGSVKPFWKKIQDYCNTAEFINIELFISSTMPEKEPKLEYLMYCFRKNKDLNLGSPLHNAFQNLIRRNITGLLEFDLAQSCSGASLSSQMYGVKNLLVKRKKPLSEGYDWFISKRLRPDPSADLKDVSVLQVLSPKQFDVLTADYECSKLKV